MKKIRVGLAAILVLGMMMTGCGNEAEPAESEKALWAEADAKELATYIVENTEFKDFMDMVDREIFSGLYNLEESMVEDVALYASTGATAEEVAVIKATDGNGEAVKEACAERVEAQKQGFENYVPEELTKLETPIILVEDDTVIFVVCDDSAVAEALISNYANEEV